MSNTPYKQAQLDEQWDAIVIGAGVGGLTTAILLARHGHQRVLVLERHYRAGGFTHTFHRPGYEWDVGLHYVGQVQEESSVVRKLFDHVTRGGVCWHPMPEVYDLVMIDGESYKFHAGMEQFREGLAGQFPKEKAAIDRYLDAVCECNNSMYAFSKEKVASRVVSMLAGPWMRRPYLHWARQTTCEVLDTITTNRELRGVLTAQWPDYGLTPKFSSFAIHASIVHHYQEGASYPVGGAAAIARAMTSEVEAYGGKVVTAAETSRILLDRGRVVGVRMADGREFRSKLVISAAGAVNTFTRLLPAEMPSLRSFRRKLAALSDSTAHVGLYVGLSGTAESLNLTASNLWIYPSYDHDVNAARFAQQIDGPLPGMFLSFPSAKDPASDARFPGHSTATCLVLAPYAAFANWANTRWRHRDTEYEELKRRIAGRMIAEMIRQVPSVAGHIAYTELSTPLTTQHFMNYGNGEIYGLAATPERFRMRALGARTPVPGLYLSGQDVWSAGVVGALMGGYICASAALHKKVIPLVMSERAA